MDVVKLNVQEEQLIIFATKEIKCDISSSTCLALKKG
jgi:hypothetical protein